MYVCSPHCCIISTCVYTQAGGNAMSPGGHRIQYVASPPPAISPMAQQQVFFLWSWSKYYNSLNLD